MSRRPKKGLDYFPKDVDYYDDFKIMDLMNEYGPLGQTIYDVVLCMVYHEGYYLEVPKMEHLAVKIIKTIGNRWIKKKDFVLQVIHYCADIGLFDKALLNQNVITSAGIQRRYNEVTVRNKVDKSKYWLIDKNGQPLLNARKNPISVAEKPINVAEIQIDDAEIQQNKRKVNNYIYYSNPELEESFRRYIGMRNSGQRAPLSKEQIDVLKKELDRIGKDDPERIAICDKAFASGWKSFYPIRKNTGSEKNHNAPKKGANFQQRRNNYSEIEKRMIRKINGTDPKPG